MFFLQQQQRKHDKVWRKESPTVRNTLHSGQYSWQVLRRVSTFRQIHRGDAGRFDIREMSGEQSSTNDGWKCQRSMVFFQLQVKRFCIFVTLAAFERYELNCGSNGPHLTPCRRSCMDVLRYWRLSQASWFPCPGRHSSWLPIVLLPGSSSKFWIMRVFHVKIQQQIVCIYVFPHQSPPFSKTDYM